MLCVWLLGDVTLARRRCVSSTPPWFGAASLWMRLPSERAGTASFVRLHKKELSALWRR